MSLICRTSVLAVRRLSRYACRSHGTRPADTKELISELEARRLRRQAQRTLDAELLAALPARARGPVHLEAIVRRKEERFGGTRCPKCWFPVNQTGTNFCICPQMPPLQLSRRCRFLIYMHHRELYNCGDDAKILLCAAPRQTELFVFGRPGDAVRLREAIIASRAAVLLFPDEAGLEAEAFAQSYLEQGPAGDSEMSELAIVLLDGTWNSVKQLRRHFHREVAPGTPCVRLQPETPSVYARAQTRPDGVSSVEALALLLAALGEAPHVCTALTEYVQRNNAALSFRHGRAVVTASSGE